MVSPTGLNFFVAKRPKSKRSKRVSHPLPSEKKIRNKSWVLGLFGLLVITSLFVLIPAPANASVVPPTNWGSTVNIVSPTVTPNSAGGGLDIRPNGKIAVTYQSEEGTTDHCYIAVTNDYGATFFPNKQITATVSSNQNGCEVKWLTDTSLIVAAAGENLYYSTDSALTLLDKTPTTGGITNCGTDTSIATFGASEWMLICTQSTTNEYIAWTTNAGTSYTVTTVSGSHTPGGLYNLGSSGSYAWKDGGTVKTTSNGGVTSTSRVTNTAQYSGTSYFNQQSNSLWSDATSSCWIGTVVAAQSPNGIVNGQVSVECKTDAEVESIQGLQYGSATTETFSSSFALIGEGTTSSLAYTTFRHSTSSTADYAVIGQRAGTAWYLRNLEDVGVTTYNPYELTGNDDNIVMLITDTDGGPVHFKLLVGPKITSTVGTVSIPVTNLVEGDFSGDGTVLIARTNSGANVRTFDAGTGTQLGSVATTDCDFQSTYGVSVIYTTNGYYTSYAECDTSNNLVDEIRVRNQLLTVPSDDFGLCDANNPENGNYNVPGDMSDLGELHFALYNGVTREEGGLSGDNDFCYMGWTFSTLSGEVGAVAVVTNQGLSTTTGDRVLVNVNPGVPVDDFCNWYNSVADKEYVMGVTIAGPTVGARITTTIIDGSGENPDGIDLTGSIIFTNAGTWSHAVAISCAGNQAFIKTQNGNVYLINVTTPTGGSGTTQKWTAPVSSTEFKSVTLSADGRFAAWEDGAFINVAYASNGTVGIQFPIPPGVWKGMKLDRTGANLAVFTSDFISVYTIAPFTCTDDCNPTVDDGGNPIGDTDTGSGSSSSSSTTGIGTGLPTGGGGFIVDPDAPNNFFGIDINYVSTQWGIPEQGFRWMLGLYVTGIVVGGITLGRSGGIALLLGAVGVLIASGICVAFGLFPVWFLLLEILLVIVLAGRLFFSNDASDE